MTYSRLLDEVNQGHRVRKHLYQSLEEELGKNKRVIAFLRHLYSRLCCKTEMQPCSKMYFIIHVCRIGPNWCL